jgi:hypothetical protein
VADADRLIGQVLDTMEGDPDLNGKTTVIVTTDHGGIGTDPSDPTLGVNYAGAVLCLGSRRRSGQRLVRADHERADPRYGRPDYTAPIPPIRNAEAANLASELLRVPAIPKSQISANQNLDFRGTDERPALLGTIS